VMFRHCVHAAILDVMRLIDDMDRKLGRSRIPLF
jgi:hypothetical protein